MVHTVSEERPAFVYQDFWALVHARVARAHPALSGAMEENAHETARREREFHEVQAELERTRLERDDWERTAMQERVTADEARAALEVAQREAAVERDAAQRAEDELEIERTNARNLQSVLEDFQSGEPVSNHNGHN